jgi:ATP-dependent Lhr-like helicase
VWAGELTNDTLTPLRARSCGAALVGAGADAPAGMIRSWRRGAGEPFRSRRVVPPGAEGRWSLLPAARARALGDGAPVRGMLGGDKPEDGAEPPSEGASAAAARDARAANDVERRAALARALLARYGVLTREAVRAEGHAGGFGAVYDVLRAMEDAGRVRRGYFVEGLGAAQFAEPGADDALRALREPPPEPATVVLAATDPASPYGAALPWPGVTSPATTTARAPCSHDAGIGGETEADGDTTPWEERSARAGTAREEVLADTPRRTARVAGAHVVLHGGRLVAYLSRGAEGTAAGATGRGGRAMLTFLPLDEIAAARIARAVAQALAAQAYAGRWRALTIATVDGIPVAGLSVGGARSRPASIDGHGALEAGGLRAPRSHAAAASARTMVDALLATGFVQTRGGLLLRAPRRHSATA